MEQENNIPSDTTSIINIESSVNSTSENYPSITIETDEVQTETDSVDIVNEGKDLSCPHASSNGNVSSKEDRISDRLDRSPNEKKIVSFADDQGFDLENVRHFPKNGLPQISKSAFADLKVPQSSLDEHSSKKAKGRSKSKRLTFIPMFHQPGADPQFFHRVRQQNVCLENVLINGITVKGIIIVSNLGFQKLVQVSFSTNCWKTKTDISAHFLSSHSTDNSFDRFECVIRPTRMPVGARLVFAIKYIVNGYEFWDNNYGFNYSLDCVIDCS